MRNVRLAPAGSLILVLLVCMGGGAAGQTDGDASLVYSPVPLTAHLRSDAIVTPYSLEFAEDHVTYRDQVERWVVTESSDPRFTGEATIAARVRSYGPASDTWLARRVLRVETAEGAWLSRPTDEAWLKFRGLPFTVVFTGEGAYQGWTIVALATPSGAYQMVLEGHIYDGELPHPPDLPAE